MPNYYFSKHIDTGGVSCPTTKIDRIKSTMSGLLCQSKKLKFVTLSKFSSSVVYDKKKNKCRGDQSYKRHYDKNIFLSEYWGHSKNIQYILHRIKLSTITSKNKNITQYRNKHKRKHVKWISPSHNLIFWLFYHYSNVNFFPRNFRL